MSSYRVAIVGEKKAVAGFALLGVDIVPAHTDEEALEALYRLKKTTHREPSGRERNAYGIVFITEDLIGAMTVDDERKLSRGALPAIITLPSHKGSTGYGIARLKRIVERAIGSDILQ